MEQVAGQVEGHGHLRALALVVEAPERLLELLRQVSLRRPPGERPEQRAAPSPVALIPPHVLLEPIVQEAESAAPVAEGPVQDRAAAAYIAAEHEELVPLMTVSFALPW